MLFRMRMGVAGLLCWCLKVWWNMMARHGTLRLAEPIRLGNQISRALLRAKSNNEQGSYIFALEAPIFALMRAIFDLIWFDVIYLSNLTWPEETVQSRWCKHLTYAIQLCHHWSYPPQARILPRSIHCPQTTFNNSELGFLPRPLNSHRMKTTPHSHIAPWVGGLNHPVDEGGAHQSNPRVWSNLLG